MTRASRIGKAEWSRRSSTYGADLAAEIAARRIAGTKSGTGEATSPFGSV